MATPATPQIPVVALTPHIQPVSAIEASASEHPDDDSAFGVLAIAAIQELAAHYDAETEELKKAIHELTSRLRKLEKPK